MAVPFFNYPAVYERFAAEFDSALGSVGQRGAYILQGEVQKLEERLADYTGAAHCITVSNATDALQLVMMADDLPEAGEVIISTHTMVATASAIHFAGGVPIPVEIGPDHLMDVESARAAITDNTVAICPTQLNGRTMNMDRLIRLAQEFELRVFEDAAQGLGSSFRGKSAGTWGRGSCLSFYPSKILGTLGDGGAILTNDDELADKLLLMRDHGRIDRGDTTLWGFNSRLDNLSAAFLLIALDDFDATVARRRDVARRYDEKLRDLPGMTLPTAPTEGGEHFDTYQNYEIEFPNRDALQIGLKQRGVGTLQQWGGWPIHRFKKLGFTQDLPAADALFDRMLMLPMNMSLTDRDVDYVCDQVVAVITEMES